jgi:D-amino-acid dehydrogenase
LSKHVLIIGAGVVGLFTGHYLLERGFRVTIVDRGSPPDQGCSFGNAGYVCPSHIIPLSAPGMVRTALRMMLNPASPFYIKPRIDAELFSWSWKFFRSATAAHVARSAPLLRDLNVASRTCYEELAAAPGNDFELKHDGLLMLCKSPQALEHEAKLADRANALGVEASVLDAKQTAQLEPAIALDILGAVYFPGDCHITPGKLMLCLRARVEEAGGTIHWNTELAGFATNGRGIISAQVAGNSGRSLSPGAPVQGTVGVSPDREIAADEFVLCAGSWSPMVARELRLKLPMQAGKGYSLTLPNPRKVPRIPSILTEARVAVTPMGQRLRFGGTMEIAGINTSISPRRVAQIVRSVPAYFPEFTTGDFAGVVPWCGLRPCSPDGLPYVGRARAFENLTIASGHAMMGISLAGITGKLVGQLLVGEKPQIDLTMLSPDRFSRG